MTLTIIPTSSEYAQQAVLERARLAENLRENVLLRDILTELEDETVAGWIAAEDPEERDAHWHAMQAVMRVRGKLESAIGGGALARSRASKRERGP